MRADSCHKKEVASIQRSLRSLRVARQVLFCCAVGWLLQAPSTHGQSSSATLPDGRIWAGGTVTALTVQEDGKVIIAGGFDAVNGVLHDNVARLNPNGSLDETWSPDATVRPLALAGTNLLVWGPSGLAKMGTRGANPASDQLVCRQIGPGGRAIDGGDQSTRRGDQWGSYSARLMTPGGRNRLARQRSNRLQPECGQSDGGVQERYQFRQATESAGESVWG